MTDNRPCGNVLGRLVDCVKSGMERGVEQFKSACPPNMRVSTRWCPDQRSEVAEDEADIGLPCTEKRSCATPSQTCSKSIPCYIKMQDPYALPCCEPEKLQPPPCPPKSHRRQSRKPTCICDLCKKKGAGSHKCCGGPIFFRN